MNFVVILMRILNLTFFLVFFFVTSIRHFEFPPSCLFKFFSDAILNHKKVSHGKTFFFSSANLIRQSQTSVINNQVHVVCLLSSDVNFMEIKFCILLAACFSRCFFALLLFLIRMTCKVVQKKKTVLMFRVIYILPLMQL